jgi:catalase (peroxidase I)
MGRKGDDTAAEKKDNKKKKDSPTIGKDRGLFYINPPGLNKNAKPKTIPKKVTSEGKDKPILKRS